MGRPQLGGKGVVFEQSVGLCSVVKTEYLYGKVCGGAVSEGYDALNWEVHSYLEIELRTCC